MRTAVLVLLITTVAGAALAGVPVMVPFQGHLGLRGVVGLISFGALGGMLAWHLRK